MSIIKLAFRSLAISRHLGLFPKAKITFVIHGDIGSETTKLNMIQCLYNQAKYRKLTVNCLAVTAIISSDVMCKRPIDLQISVQSYQLSTLQRLRIALTQKSNTNDFLYRFVRILCFYCIHCSWWLDMLW